MTEMVPDAGGMVAPEMLAAVLDGSPDLAQRIRSMVAPVQREREAIRAYLLGSDDGDDVHIAPLPTDSAYTAVGACDGGFVLNSLALGDHVSTLAVAVRSCLSGVMQIAGHRAWSDFLTHHSDDAAVMTQAVMMAGELSLLSSLDDGRTVTMIDGSHVTPLIAVNVALASTEQRVRDEVYALADDGLVDWVRYAAESPTVVACPKFDSSTDLWTALRGRMPSLAENGLPDKVLASMVLEPGEMLVSRRDAGVASWRRLYDTVGRSSDDKARALAQDLVGAAEALRRTPHIRVYHLKPVGAAAAIRVEVKPVDDFETADVIAAIGNDCAPPFVQEPVAQYLADIMAKSVSAAANFQMESARLALADAGETSLLDFLLRRYRTSTSTEG